MLSIARVGEQAATAHAVNKAARIRPMGVTRPSYRPTRAGGLVRTAFLRFEPEDRKGSAVAAGVLHAAIQGLAAGS
jgi:hypothetical protein